MPNLTGKRTYIVAAAMLAFASLGLWLGKIDGSTASNLIFEALGIAGLRAAIANQQ